ncbi:hypothetical protein AAHA92_21776 [Salvia divinorum]|uniref:Uncharacterized protein n=1 Tax=Salvia divinorum TaxID=28513 RepID=A0ABD1GMS0_SALDI
MAHRGSTLVVVSSRTAPTDQATPVAKESDYIPSTPEIPSTPVLAEAEQSVVRVEDKGKQEPIHVPFWQDRDQSDEEMSEKKTSSGEIYAMYKEETSPKNTVPCSRSAVELPAGLLCAAQPLSLVTDSSIGMPSNSPLRGSSRWAVGAAALFEQ